LHGSGLVQIGLIALAGAQRTTNQKGMVDNIRYKVWPTIIGLYLIVWTKKSIRDVIRAIHGSTQETTS